MFNNLQEIGVKGQEKVVVATLEPNGLQAIIAIHNTKRGPALGGVRMFPYSDFDAAILDVKRLAEAMTFKATAAHLPFGGGKAVIIGDPATQKVPGLYESFGQFINSLDGRYITAEDVGTGKDDIATINLATNYVCGLKDGNKEPSLVTAVGVFASMRYSLERLSQHPIDDFTGLKVAIQGAGKVGFYLAKLLRQQDASLYISDTNRKQAERIRDIFGARIVEPEEIYDLKVNVFAPCAMGGVLNTETISRLNCELVCGAANNQLEDPLLHSTALKSKGILYAVDFIVNAGGLRNVAYEFMGQSRYLALKDTATKTPKILGEVFDLAQSLHTHSYLAANILVSRLLVGSA